MGKININLFSLLSFITIHINLIKKIYLVWITSIFYEAKKIFI